MKFGKTGILGLCLLGAAALVLALLSPSFFSGNGQAPSERPGQRDGQPWPLAAKGVVESEETIDIASEINGRVAEVLVDEGDQVTAGQVLLRFEKSKIEAKVAAANAALIHASARRSETETGYRRQDVAAARHVFERAEATSAEARRNFERHQRLFAQGAVTRVDRDRAEEAWQVADANLKEAKVLLEKMQTGSRSEDIAAARAAEEQARAELQNAQALFNDYEIVSPINGVLINRYRDPGETVDIGAPLLTIVNPQKLRIWSEIDETDVGKVSLGQSVSVNVDALAQKDFKGKVTKVNAAVQRKSQKTFDPVASFDINSQRILIALDNYDGLVHGMSVTVRFLK